MYHINLNGSYYQMGYQQGQLLKQAGFTLPAPEEKMLRFARECEKIVGQYMPGLLDEIRGVAEGAHIEYDAVMTLTMTAPFDPQEVPGCSIVAVMPERTQNKKLIVGRNFDMPYTISKEGATTYCTCPEGHYASIGNCDIWVGRWDGFNEAGLFTASAALLLPEPTPVLPGPVGWFTGRHILDNFAAVEEAVAFTESLPRTGSGSRLVADTSGAVVIEVGVTGMQVRYPEDGLLIVTNHAVCPQFAGTEIRVPPSSHSRFNRLDELLRKRNVTIEDVKRALSDHTGGVCAHEVDPSGEKYGTIWSMVGIPGERTVYIADGHPCRSAYKTIEF